MDDNDGAVGGKLAQSAKGTSNTMSADEAHTDVSKQKQSDETFDEATPVEVERGTTNDDIEKDKDTHPFSRKTWKEDLTLVVEGRNLYVSKAIIGVSSPVFNELFEEDPVDTMEMPNETYESVVEFLCCLYPNIRKPVTVQNIPLVMPLALEYQTDCLITECKSVITNNATQSAPCDVLPRLIQLCQILKLKTMEGLCWEAVREKDVDGIEAMEVASEDTEIKLKLSTIKSDQLKRSVNKYALETSKLKKERDSLDDILRFLMGNMEMSEQQEVFSIRGGIFGTIRVKFVVVKSELKVSEQSNYEYGVTFKTKEMHRNNIYVAQKYLVASFGVIENYSTVKGRVTVEHRVSLERSRSFPFFVQFSKKRNFVDIDTLPLSDIVNVANGYLVQSEGIIQFEYISKR